MIRDYWRSGYIAILSALILVTIILIVAVTLGQASFFHRANLTGAYSKERSKAAADACLNTALLKLVFNPAYTGGETINVASDTCSIVSVAPSGTTAKIVKVESQIQNSFTDYQITVAATSVNIIGWEEPSHF